MIKYKIIKAFPATHRHITKNFNAIIEEPETVPDWLTTGITYLIPKSGNSKEVRNYRPITCLTTMYKTLTGIIAKSQKNLHTFGRAELTISSAKRMSSWK